MVTGWTVRGLNHGSGKISVSSPKRPNRLCGPHNLIINAFRRSFLRVKRPKREVNNSPPSSLEVKNKWIYASIPPIYLHCVDIETSLFKITNLPLRDGIQTTSTRIDSRIIVIAILLPFLKPLCYIQLASLTLPRLTSCFSVHKLYTLPTQCLSVCGATLKTNSDASSEVLTAMFVQIQTLWNVKLSTRKWLRPPWRSIASLVITCYTDWRKAYI